VPPWNARMRIPILMYHEVGLRESSAERYTVTTEAFREQLRHLRDHGYRTLVLGQPEDPENSSGRGAKTVAITFDDNNLCHHSVSTPILAEFGFRATFFIVSGFVGRPGDMLSAEQLREMQRAGMSIESHSHTHRFLSDLDEPEIHAELRDSRRILEDQLHKEVRFLSCPGGRYSPKVLECARAAGYHGVCTSAPGLSEAGSWTPARKLDRFLISATTGLETFAKIVAGDTRYVRGQMLRYRGKAILKGMLGNRRYDALWRRYRRDL